MNLTGRIIECGMLEGFFAPKKGGRLIGVQLPEEEGTWLVLFSSEEAADAASAWGLEWDELGVLYDVDGFFLALTQHPEIRIMVDPTKDSEGTLTFSEVGLAGVTSTNRASA
jgi:hypothetical protein